MWPRVDQKDVVKGFRVKGRAKRVDRGVYVLDELTPGARRRISRIALEPAHDLGHQLARGGGIRRDPNTSRLERFHFRLRGALRSGDDRPRVPHLLARRGGDAGDVADDRLRHLGAYEVGGFLLPRTADLSEHDHGFRIGIGFEQRQAVDEARPWYGITADAYARRNANALLGEVVQRLIRKRA